jgi:hypothetical protein
MVLMSRRIAALAGILILYWISSAPYERSSIMFAHSQDSIAFIAPCAQPVEPVPELITGEPPRSRGCNGNGCNPDVSECVLLGPAVSDTCCVDLDRDRKYHCAVCLRNLYACPCGEDFVPVIGPAYACQPIRPYIRCQPSLSEDGR